MACQPPEQRRGAVGAVEFGRAGRTGGHRGLVESVSASTVRRWLAEDAIKPWRFRSWIFPRDKDFAVKAGRVLDLYERVWDGEELGDERVRDQC